MIKYLMSIDFENEIRLALKDSLTVYCRPLPKDYGLPNILISQVGGKESDTVDTNSIVLDARAKTEAEASEYLRKAIGLLKAAAKNQTTNLRYVTINTAGSWGNDPVRPDLAMCSARLDVVAHQIEMED